MICFELNSWTWCTFLNLFLLLLSYNFWPFPYLIGHQLVKKNFLVAGLHWKLDKVWLIKIITTSMIKQLNIQHYPKRQVNSCPIHSYLFHFLFMVHHMRTHLGEFGSGQNGRSRLNPYVLYKDPATHAVCVCGVWQICHRPAKGNTKDAVWFELLPNSREDYEFCQKQRFGAPPFSRA